MTDRAQLAALGAQTSGGDWPADLDPSLRCGTLGAHVEQPALAVGDYLAPIGDDPTTPGPAARCWGEGIGLYSVSWFDRHGDFTHSHSIAAGSLPRGCQRIPGPRPLAPRPPDPQPAPLPGTGDVWQEVIDGLDLDDPIRPICVARRALGVERYGTPLQRGNGRDEVRDTDEELADVLVYAQAEGDTETVEDCKRIMRRRLRRREGR